MTDEREPDFFDIEMPPVDWMTLDGKFFMDEADYAAGGMKWRVHLTDADPFPSSPHAHCVAGQERHVGCKLHLGTGVLYSRERKPWKKLPKRAFADLIEKVRPKFPGIQLPLVEN